MFWVCAYVSVSAVHAHTQAGAGIEFWDIGVGPEQALRETPEGRAMQVCVQSVCRSVCVRMEVSVRVCICVRACQFVCVCVCARAKSAKFVCVHGLSCSLPLSSTLVLGLVPSSSPCCANGSHRCMHSLNRWVRGPCACERTVFFTCVEAFVSTS